MSIFVSDSAPGDGGGVCSYAFRPTVGGGANVTDFVDDDAVEDLGRDGVTGDEVLDVCDRFAFLAGGGFISAALVGFVGDGR